MARSNTPGRLCGRTPGFHEAVDGSGDPLVTTIARPPTPSAIGSLAGVQPLEAPSNYGW